MICTIHFDINIILEVLLEISCLWWNILNFWPFIKVLTSNFILQQLEGRQPLLQLAEPIWSWSSSVPTCYFFGSHPVGALYLAIYVCLSVSVWVKIPQFLLWLPDRRLFSQVCGISQTFLRVFCHFNVLMVLLWWCRVLEMSTVANRFSTIKLLTYVGNVDLWSCLLLHVNGYDRKYSWLFGHLVKSSKSISSYVTN